MMQESKNKLAEPNHKRGCGSIFFFLMLVVGSIWGASMGLGAHILGDARGTIEALEEFRPKIGSRVFTSDGLPLGEFTTERRHLVRLTDIPLHLQKAFLATEDHRFYEHKGVPVSAIFAIGLQYIQTGTSRGGSGITQQVVRNVEDLEVGLERTVQRKIREAIVSLQVEREFTKDEILELYLNQIFLGISAYGVEAASWQYFGKPCSELTLGESATLAGLTRAPNPNNPINNMNNALARRNIVLEQMLRQGFITEDKYHHALQEDLRQSVLGREEIGDQTGERRATWVANRFNAPYFAEEVRRFVLAQYEKEQVFEDGLEIRTTLDMRLQQAAEDALLGALEAFDERALEQLKRQGKENEFVPVSGALLCIDNRTPYKGYIRAMVGGRDFYTEQYNTTTQARRQPGSSVKPFVWAAAIENGLTPSTIIVDEPYIQRDVLGRIWRPGNFDGTFQGPIPIRLALEKSVNIVSIKLAERVGPTQVRSIMQRSGIRTPIDPNAGLTIALGATDLTVMDQAVAFATLASGGVRHDPVMITEIRDRDGLIRYNYQDYTRSERAFDASVAYVVTHMLEAAARYGTGARTAPLERPRAGKTGTSNESRNVWFCGYTPDFTAIVWVGYRDNRPLGRGIEFTGGRLAAPIWTEFMIAAHEGLPVREFEVPDGVDFFNVDRQSGVAGGSYREAFVRGTAPPVQAYRPPVQQPLFNDNEMVLDLLAPL